MAMIYLAGIDTLVIGFYLGKFDLYENDYISLNTAKELAKAQVFKSTGEYIKFREMPFVMSPAGRQPYTYVLQNCDITLKLAQKVSKGKFPEVYIELRSDFLWRLGYKQAYEFIREWVGTWAEILSDVISRADIAIDIQGRPEISIENIVSRARKGKEYHDFVPIQQGEFYYYGSKITGWVFGSGPLMMRIYDKTTEIKKVHKDWFGDLWKQRGWDGQSDVTRVELQLRRDFLKDFNVTTFESFQKTLGDIFRYVTHDWLTLREPSSDKNRSRWPITPFWADVQTAIDSFGKTYGISRGRIEGCRGKFLIAQVAGLATSIAATRENFDFEDLLLEVNEHYKSHGQTFEDAIAEKKKRRGTFEDGHEPF